MNDTRTEKKQEQHTADAAECLVKDLKVLLVNQNHKENIWQYFTFYKF